MTSCTIHEKQWAFNASRQKQIKLNERLTQDIIYYGLWQTKEEAAKGVTMEKCKTTKLTKLKALKSN